MPYNHYARFGSGKMILRDELAVDRTLLSNERTLLAYLRSAISLVIAGASIINFAKSEWFTVVGVVCIPLGILVGIFGSARYHKMNKAIMHVRMQQPLGGEEDPDTAST